MDVGLFEEIGLSKGETKVYLTLLELGGCKVGMVIEKSGLQSSTVHTCLNTLLEKGLVKYIKKGKIKHYTASDPKFLVEILKDREQRLEKILPELKLMQSLSSEKEESEIYKGLAGVRSMIYKMIEDGKPGEEFLFFGGSEEAYDEAVEKVYFQYDLRRKEMGLKVFGIQSEKKRSMIDKIRYAKQRFADFPLPPNMGVFRDRIVMISWKDRPTGFLIESKVIADQYREMFWNIWERAKS